MNGLNFDFSTIDFNSVMWLVLWLIAINIGLRVTLYLATSIDNIFRISGSRKTGAEVAQELLASENIKTVKVICGTILLGEHYNPSTHQIVLSDALYHRSSVAAVAIASHEAGHAYMDFNDHFSSRIRLSTSAILRVSSASNLTALIFGVSAHFKPLVTIGVLLYAATILLSIITFFDELNSSRWAIRKLAEREILSTGELIRARIILGIALMTYMFELLNGVWVFLMVMMASSKKKDDDKKDQ